MSLARRRPKRLRMVAAALCLCIYGGCAGAQQFGRLFTTAEQRLYLDGLREANQSAPRERDNTRQKPVAPPAGKPPAAEVITLRGVVYRQDNTRMAWIDDGSAAAGVAAVEYLATGGGETAENNVTLELPGTGESVTLKPGQSYDPESGAILDLTGGPP